MGPKTRVLVMQPQVRLTHCVGTHLLPSLLILAILIDDAAISNGMDDMHSLLAQFPSERLGQLSHRSAACTVRSELRTAAERAKRAGKD
jgi:hypothetical protein